MVEPVAYERPKLEPVLKEGDVGSDETRKTVGFLMLASLVPELIGGLVGHGSLSFVALGLPALTAWSLLTADDFICTRAFLSCVVQLVMAPVLMLALPHSGLLIFALMLRYGSLALLLSGRALSKKAYFTALGTIGLGILLGIISSVL